MSGVAIEDLLELWSAELRKAKARLSWLIGHPSVVASAAAFLDTLLGPERRKTGWMRAEAAGDAGPWRQQAVLGRSHWDADALRDVVRDYALETLAEGDAVLVIDETGFLKQGTASCGVDGSIPLGGQDHNCRSGLRRLCVHERPAFIDRQLYLPKPGPTARSAGRRPCARGCHVRDQATARGRDDRAGDRRRGGVFLGGGGQCLRRWRGGNGAAPGWQGIRARCREHDAVPLLGQAGAGVRHGRGDRRSPAGLALGSAVRRRRDQGTPPLRLGLCGAGRSRCPSLLRLSLRVDDVTRGLLIPAWPGDAKMAFFSTWCPKGTPMAVLVEVEGRRWAIEDAFETAKTELGLAHNETRSWHGWHRHVSLVMLAFALLMVIRHKAETLTSPQKSPPTEQHKLWSDGPSRRSVVLPGV